MTQDNRVPLMFDVFAQVRDGVLARIADWSTEDVRNIQIMVRGRRRKRGDLMGGPILQWIAVEVAAGAFEDLWPYFMDGVAGDWSGAEADYACTVIRPNPRGFELLFWLVPRLDP